MISTMADSTDPITPLMESAAQIHELYESLVAAGFTEAQALYLTGVILAAKA